MNCEELDRKYSDKIEKIVDIQRHESRESIFFFYEDGRTTEIIKGEETYIDIPRYKQRRIFKDGEVLGSVHTHPAGFDPSTIDIMTAIATKQDHMAVAVPIQYNDGTLDYTISTLDTSGLNRIQKFHLFRSMRRSTVGLTNMGRLFRKQFNIQISGAEGCRTHKVEVDGLSVPVMNRPSVFDIELGREVGVVDEEDQWLD